MGVSTPDRRTGAVERRQFARGGRRASDIGRTALFALLYAAVSVSTASAQNRVQFGVDATSAARARQSGLQVGYGSLWAGAWNQKYGWGGIESQLLAAKSAGVTPLVHWWYWGDDISPTCVENGCVDRYHGVPKNKATWYRMSNELADLIARVSAGSAARPLVVIETEFNKNGIENYEPFDGYLAEHALFFHNRGLDVIISFGNWGRAAWPRFDRAIAAADMLGAMVLKSSVRNATSYLSGANELLSAVQYYQVTFGKPSFVTDFAFSSYPEPDYALYQDTVIRDIFSRMSQFRAAGVRGMVWRMLADDPNFNTANYHGMAERYWGLLRANGTQKPSFIPFRDGVLAEIGAPPAAVPAPPTNVTAAPGNASVTLNWSAVSGATSYNVRYSTTSGGPYQVVATGITGISFVHSNLSNGIAYHYVVSAQNQAGQSGWSIQVSATPIAPPPAPTLPPPPTNLVATAGDAKVTLSWSPVATATSYSVRFSTTSGGPYQTAASGTGTTFVHSGLTNGFKYYYVVTSQNAAGPSGASIEVSATPAAAPTGASINIWWPTNAARVSGTQPFKAVLQGWAVTQYRMYWRVDAGQLNHMYDSYVDWPHKEAIVSVATWNWRGQGPYTIDFIATDLNGKTVGVKTVQIYVVN
jgi:fibronectin type III domain protein